MKIRKYACAGTLGTAQYDVMSHSEVCFNFSLALLFLFALSSLLACDEKICID